MIMIKYFKIVTFLMVLSCTSMIDPFEEYLQFSDNSTQSQFYGSDSSYTLFNRSYLAIKERDSKKDSLFYNYYAITKIYDDSVRYLNYNYSKKGSSKLSIVYLYMDTIKLAIDDTLLITLNDKDGSLVTVEREAIDSLYQPLIPDSLASSTIDTKISNYLSSRFLHFNTFKDKVLNNEF